MKFSLKSGVASWLTPQTSGRLDELGPGTTIGRARVHEVWGSPRAADQFIHQALRNGLLMPVAWGRYAVPNLSAIDRLRRVPSPEWATLVSHALTLPRLLHATPDAPRFLGFLMPRLLGVRVKSTGSAPVFALEPSATQAPVAPLPGDGFFIDPLDPKPEPLELQLGSTRIDALVPSLADAARLLSSTLEPRLVAAARSVLRGATAAQKAVVATSRPRWAPPQRAPQPSRAEARRLGAGPPQQYRLLAPEWYMRMVQGATEALTRRTIRLA